ncbi:polysaccharide deacetylase family protein [Yinghuangia sp. YIM S09857]|uniref:polysaccharide deacetylase family protein n=1 Tax=Yinghuangia sp. YIM S09857 TaxID=3436929 RepID=UPI003F5349AA
MGVDRRSLIKGAAAAAAGVVAAGCGSGDPAAGRGGGAASGTPDSVRSAAAPHPAAPHPGTSAPPPAAADAPGPHDLPPLPAAMPPEVARAATGRPEVALTFHGQGDPAGVERLLAVVERARVGITVLAVGTWLGEYPAMAGRVLAGGHELGNHSEHHLDMLAMDAETAYREIAACADRLTALTGSRGRWFRPSQTQYANAVVKAQAARAGYPTCLAYSLDSRDHTEPGPAAVVRNVLDQVAAGDVVSLHFGHDGTTAALPALLDGLRGRGLRPVTASALFTPTAA